MGIHNDEYQCWKPAKLIIVEFVATCLLILFYAAHKLLAIPPPHRLLTLAYSAGKSHAFLTCFYLAEISKHEDNILI